MVVFDTSVLLLVLNPNAKPPKDSLTGQTVEKAPERIQHLISRLSKSKTKILIPTPVLSEVLVHAGNATNEYLEKINRENVFRIVPFDQKAAIEAAISTHDALARGNFKIDAADPNATRGKVKFDRQIVAIAKAEGASAIYSDDADVVSYTIAAGLKAYRTVDLDLRPEELQGSLNV
jgi:predicted nucleic acid-binding protein